jgi:hypothetical protein
MARNKNLRKKIAGYHDVIANHEGRIQIKLAKEHPDESLIASWQREIGIWKETVGRLMRRLKREW